MDIYIWALYKNSSKKFKPNFPYICCTTFHRTDIKTVLNISFVIVCFTIIITSLELYNYQIYTHLKIQNIIIIQKTIIKFWTNFTDMRRQKVNDV